MALLAFPLLLAAASLPGCLGMWFQEPPRLAGGSAFWAYGGFMAPGWIPPIAPNPRQRKYMMRGVGRRRRPLPQPPGSSSFAAPLPPPRPRVAEAQAPEPSEDGATIVSDVPSLATAAQPEGMTSEEVWWWERIPYLMPAEAWKAPNAENLMQQLSGKLEEKLLAVLRNHSEEAQRYAYEAHQIRAASAENGEPSVPTLLDRLEKLFYVFSQKSAAKFDFKLLQGDWRLEYSEELPQLVREQLTAHPEEGGVLNLEVTRSVFDSGDVQTRANISFASGKWRFANVSSNLTRTARAPIFISAGRDVEKERLVVTYASMDVLIIQHFSDVDDGKIEQFGAKGVATEAMPTTFVWRRIGQSVREIPAATPFASLWRFGLPFITNKMLQDAGVVWSLSFIGLILLCAFGTIAGIGAFLRKCLHFEFFMPKSRAAFLHESPGPPGGTELAMTNGGKLVARTPRGVELYRVEGQEAEIFHRAFAARLFGALLSLILQSTPLEFEGAAADAPGDWDYFSETTDWKERLPQANREITNKGKTVQVDGSFGRLRLPDGEYEVKSFNFSFPAKLTGRLPAGEIHIVHEKRGANGEDCSYAVIALFLQQVETMPETLERRFLESLGFGIPVPGRMRRTEPPAVDWRAFREEFNGGFYHHRGSLTTAPNSPQNVNWYVLQKTVPVTKEMIDAFAARFPPNRGPAQTLNTRYLVYNDINVPKAFLPPSSAS
eukprot:TRINITY_DN62726_c0_g1_i1.p1 TRINITY_DN62726_c0_g1~~TRINITY_DN62726_c0_g1_i1.p1  ORF type:complete len:718 (-),score=138.40 TRINITY_DN62726_c0_g1_i1:310-2463(-)